MLKYKKYFIVLLPFFVCLLWINGKGHLKLKKFGKKQIAVFGMKKFIWISLYGREMAIVELNKFPQMPFLNHNQLP